MPDPITLFSIVGYLAKELLDEVVSRIIKRTANTVEVKTLGLSNLVLGKESLDAYHQALAGAIERYAGSSGTRASIAEALLKKDGVLSAPLVKQEMAYILKFDRDPDYSQIGQVW